MGDDKQVPKKQQVNVELPTQFGGRQIQQLDIQDSKAHPHADFNWYLLNQIGVPARIPDVLADLVLWLAASTFLGSVGKQFIQFPGVLAIIAIVLVILLFLSIYVLKTASQPSIRWSLLYRWVLLFIGVCLGGR
ncbi:MAG: hypothetical protein N2235_01175 [Fischerella sp.]|nr:hypothetical protein [Fischerella sp.]